MKKILYFIILLIVIVAIIIALTILSPNIKRKCKIEEFNITLDVPYSYLENNEKTEKLLLNLYNKNGIEITATKLKEDFWSDGDIESRMDQYLLLISAVNYESGMKNVSKKILENSKDGLGVVEFELNNLNGDLITKTIISDEKIGDFVIEITGNKEIMNEKNDETEKIIKSIIVN